MAAVRVDGSVERQPFLHRTLSMFASWFGFRSGVRWQRQSRPQNCVQTVVAMALGVPTEAIERVAGTDGAMTVRQTIDLLSEFGIECRPVSAEFAAEFWEAFYRLSGGRRMRGLAFRLPRDRETVGHAYFVLGRKMYDPASGRITRLGKRRLRAIDYLAIFPPDFHARPEIARARQALH